MPVIDNAPRNPFIQLPTMGPTVGPTFPGIPKSTPRDPSYYGVQRPDYNAPMKSRAEIDAENERQRAMGQRARARRSLPEQAAEPAQANANLGVGSRKSSFNGGSREPAQRPQGFQQIDTVRERFNAPEVQERMQSLLGDRFPQFNNDLQSLFAPIDERGNNSFIDILRQIFAQRQG